MVHKNLPLCGFTRPRSVIFTSSLFTLDRSTVSLFFFLSPEPSEPTTGRSRSSIRRRTARRGSHPPSEAQSAIPSTRAAVRARPPSEPSALPARASSLRLRTARGRSAARQRLRAPSPAPVPPPPPSRFPSVVPPIQDAHPIQITPPASSARRPHRRSRASSRSRRALQPSGRPPSLRDTSSTPHLPRRSICHGSRGNRPPLHGLLRHAAGPPHLSDVSGSRAMPCSSLVLRPLPLLSPPPPSKRI
jgi:hypothetical protein